MNHHTAGEAPWQFIPWKALTLPAGRANMLSNRVSAIPDALLPAMKADGLTAASVKELKGLLPAAQTWLRRVPNLERLVFEVVGVIHPLAAEPGYDVSHSQPRWRDRIFLSCPDRTDEIGSLRLVESVVHEAMHLHLTNEEDHAPFVCNLSDMTSSPWREEERPVQGVLHALFVFACIRHFLQVITAETFLVPEGQRYVGGRLNTIESEIAQIDIENLSRSLTARGRCYVRLWKGGSVEV